MRRHYGRTAQRAPILWSLRCFALAQSARTPATVTQEWPVQTPGQLFLPHERFPEALRVECPRPARHPIRRHAPEFDGLSLRAEGSNRQIGLSALSLVREA